MNNLTVQINTVPGLKELLLANPDLEIKLRDSAAIEIGKHLFDSHYLRKIIEERVATTRKDVEKIISDFMESEYGSKADYLGNFSLPAKIKEGIKAASNTGVKNAIADAIDEAVRKYLAEKLNSASLEAAIKSQLDYWIGRAITPIVQSLVSIKAKELSEQLRG